MLKHKLLLIDALAIIYRSYYAFLKNPRRTSKGINTSATYGFVLALEDVLKKEKPSHIAVVFDPPGPTFRHKMFEGYKAKRQATPEDIAESIPTIKEILSAYNIPVLEVAGFEADDVIGTVAKMADKSEFDVYLMTPDKDFAQLVDDNIFLYKPRNDSSGFEILDVEGVKKKYTLENPSQMIDLLGLMGDASDNIPGCPGIGEKKALMLLGKFGSIDNILDDTFKLDPSNRAKIEKNKDQIILSKTLATIKTNIPINISLNDLIRKPILENKLRALFQNLEFRSISSKMDWDKHSQIPTNNSQAEEVEIVEAKRKQKSPIVAHYNDLFQEKDFEPEAAAETPQPESDKIDINTAFLSTIDTTEHSYSIIETPEEIEAFCQTLCQQKSVCFDTETTSLDSFNCELLSLAFSFVEGEAYFIPTDLPGMPEIALSILRPFFENENIEKVGQHLKFDIMVLRKFGIRVKGPLFDTMIAHYLINPELPHGLDYIAEMYLSYKTIRYEDLIGEKNRKRNSAQGGKTLRDVNKKDFFEYACEDADITFKLKKILQTEINSRDLNNLFYQVECPLVYVLVEMELAGVSLDLNVIDELSKEFSGRIIKVERDVIKLAGMNFNLNSSRQLGEVLFEHLKIESETRRPKTKSGQYKTGEEELEKLINKHPIIEKILEYRVVKKILSTYVNSLPSLINPKTGKIHSSYNQGVVATGRLSSSKPNMQNIPIRSIKGKEMRKLFVAEKGCTFLSADYSQIELRVLAHLSEDENMIHAFKTEQDIHTITASKIYKVPIESVTTQMRDNAKTANFGIIYGMSSYSLAERLNIQRSDARKLKDGYLDTYSGIKKYIEESVNFARTNGYVATIMNRRRYLPDILSRNGVVRSYSERTATNARIQGSAADIIKIAMVRIHKRFQELNLKTTMIIQVHDELNFNVPDNELDVVKKIVVEEMENAYPLNVPLKVDWGYGKNWDEAHG